MSETRDIRVLRGDSELQRQPLDLYRTPDGAEAAKWGGLVFPIRDGDSIDVRERGLLPTECRPWQEQATWWELTTEPEATGSYLFIEGSPHRYREVEKRLREAGVEVMRSGPNLSGGPGDWFIRLGVRPDGGTKALSELMGQSLKPTQPDEDSSLRERLLAQALIFSQAGQSQLRAELTSVQSLVASLSAQTEQQQALSANLEAMAHRLAEAEAEVATLQSRLETAPARSLPAKPGRLEGELATAVAALLPRFDFIGSSMRFVAVELPDRAILWRALAELDRHERGLPPSWKALSGHSGWWERHFSTGQDNQGRLYARTIGSPSRWQVLVSHKQDQSQDLKRITRMRAGKDQ